MSFWNHIQLPIVALSPMDGITDAGFRRIIAETAKPDVMLTEFVNVDGVLLGKDIVLNPLIYHEIERPIVAQVFGINPDMFYQVAKILCELGFDGIDINMGCPSKTVASRGAGAGLIRTPILAREIILAVKAGISDWQKTGLIGLEQKHIDKTHRFKEKLRNFGVQFKTERNLIPVSVKTRIGYDINIIETWIENLMQVKPANISVHGRLLKQMYSGSADWEAIAKAAEIVKALSANLFERTTLLGNGDIETLAQIPDYVEKYKVDGVLVGRATLGNPWFFIGLTDLKQGKKIENENFKNKLSYGEVTDKLIKHLEIFNSIFGEEFFISQRKQIGWYIKGFDNAASLRNTLMQQEKLADVIKILRLNS